MKVSGVEVDLWTRLCSTVILGFHLDNGPFRQAHIINKLCERIGKACLAQRRVSSILSYPVVRQCCLASVHSLLQASSYGRGCCRLGTCPHIAKASLTSYSASVTRYIRGRVFSVHRNTDRPKPSTYACRLRCCTPYWDIGERTSRGTCTTRCRRLKTREGQQTKADVRHSTTNF